MTTNANSQPGQAPQAGAPEVTPPQGGAEGQAPAPEKKTELEQRLDAALGDPNKLAELSGELLNVISSLRSENAGKRGRLKEAEEALAKYEADKKERERAEMTELERLKAENEDYQNRLLGLEQSKADLEVKTAFTDANDPDDLLLYWNRMTDEQRAATTPADWANSLKETKPYLFKSAPPAPPAGGNPRNDGGGTPPAPAPNMHPRTQADIEAIRRAHRETFSK